MGELMEALCGRKVGKSSVSRVTKVLDGHVASLSKAPIEDEMPYLFLDATFINARWARSVENVAALVAYGVSKQTGKRQLLAVTMGVTESEDSWAELLRQLIGRGIQGVKLVIADAHQGLANAVRKLFPEVRRQRCTVHFMRNILAKSPSRLQKRLGGEVKVIFKAASLKEAKKKKEAFVSIWKKELPELVTCLEKGFDAATQFYAFPKNHHKRIRTTNGIERLHLEIKRRTRTIGSFPDRKSALRLITAVALNHAKNWEARAYLDMASLDENDEQEEMENPKAA
jgi:transposase-like protein